MNERAKRPAVLLAGIQTATIQRIQLNSTVTALGWELAAVPSTVATADVTRANIYADLNAR